MADTIKNSFFTLYNIISEAKSLKIDCSYNEINRKFPIDGWVETASKLFFIKIQKGAKNTRNYQKVNYFFLQLFFGSTLLTRFPRNFF